MHIPSQLKDFKKDFFFVYMTKYTYQAKLGKIIYIMYTYNKFFVLQTLMIMTFQVSQLDSEQRKNITINYEH